MSTHPPLNPSSPPLPVAVIGSGRMGKLHARAYSQMPSVHLVGVYDANPQTAAAVAAEYHTQPFSRPEDLLPLVSAVTIAVPTQHHFSAAEPFLQRGIACLIEKPLAREIDEGQRIVDLARRHNALVQVGHIERFNPAIRAVQRLEMRPRFIEVTRISPLPFRSLDVGVVLDVMIHDIDIILKLAGSEVKRIDATGASVIGGVEDICNARLTFANGCVANLTASRLALKTERTLRIFSRDAYVSIDYQKRQGVIIRRSGNVDAIRDAVEQVRSGNNAAAVNYADLVKVEQLPIDDVEPIRAELDSFIESIRANTSPAVSAEDGLAALTVAKSIVAAMGDIELA